MQLSPEQKAALRAEEHFRAEVRRELAQPRTRGRLGQLAEFFETRVGFWLLTTVLAGTVAGGFTLLQQHLDRARVEEAERQEKARRDADMLIRLAPMLASEKPGQARYALALLEGLIEKDALDSRVATQVRSLFEEALRVGTAPNASQAQREVAEALIARSEPSLPKEQAPAPAMAAQTGASLALEAVSEKQRLPTRVYLQIATEASSVQRALRDAGMLAPGIELVKPGSAPGGAAQVRYCADKVDADAVEQVQKVVGDSFGAALQMLKLPNSLCGRVRHNHFELWFPRPGA
jgi:hypothetical protein